MATKIERELAAALMQHNFPVRTEVKPRSAKERRAAARAASQSQRSGRSNKVLKGMNSNPCTQGGRLRKAEFGSVPRGTINLRDLELDEIH